MNYQLLELVRKYTEDEWHDYLYYSQLAQKVKTAEQREMVQGFAQDEYRHSQALAAYYCQHTGRYPYVAPYQARPIPDELEEAFLGRVPPESADIKKYKELYLMAGDQQLRAIAFSAMMDETQHSIRLLYLAETAD